METNYVEVTETSGTLVSQEQVQRMYNRYNWARQYCKDKDVVEVACGSGQGIGLIGDVAASIVGGDISMDLLLMARDCYGDEFELIQFDASNMPFKDSSKDIIICFEAVYYFPDFKLFLKEVDRVLKKGGYLLISSANKDLSDFNRSPFTYSYYGVMEFKDVLHEKGFETEFFGDIDTKSDSLLSKILATIKKLAVTFNLMPKTMSGKRLLKRLVFGKLVELASDLRLLQFETNSINKIDDLKADVRHKVILVAAKKK